LNREEVNYELSDVPDVADDAGNLPFRAIPVMYTPSSGDTTMVITGLNMSDTNYGVFATPNWNAYCYITAKSTSGFTLAFSNKAGLGYGGAANTLRVVYSIVGI
jgi:hypothetical protein